MIIRLATIDDVKKIARNNVSLAEEVEQLKIDINEAINGSLSVFSDKNNSFYLLAEEKNSIIGQVYITKEWSDWRNKSIWWLHRIYVQKKWRNKGVLTSLINEIKTRAIKEDVFALRLYVFEKNEKAIDIYQKMEMNDAPFIILQNIF